LEGVNVAFDECHRVSIRPSEVVFQRRSSPASPREHLAREGVELSRATLCDWVADVASALTPIGEQLRREIVAASYLQTDDTPSRSSTTVAAVSQADSGRPIRSRATLTVA
jgi:transposase IS66 family protein